MGVAVTLLGITGYIAGLSWPFSMFLLLGVAHLWWQTATVNINDPKDCLAKFKSNREFAILVFVGIVAGRLAA